jgi:hypothetical protein
MLLRIESMAFLLVVFGMTVFAGRRVYLPGGHRIRLQH